MKNAVYIIFHLFLNCSIVSTAMNGIHFRLSDILLQCDEKACNPSFTANGQQDGGEFVSRGEAWLLVSKLARKTDIYILKIIALICLALVAANVS